MTSAVRIQTGDIEPVEIFVLDVFGQPLAGLSNLRLHIRRRSDDFFFDWNDNTFKTPTALVQQQVTLSEIDPTFDPGRYKLAAGTHSNGFDTSAIVNANPDDVYFLTVNQVGAPQNAGNVPQIGEIKVGDYVDFLDQVVSDCAAPADVTAALEAIGLDHLVQTSPGAVPPTTGTYIAQLLDGISPNAGFVVLQSFSYNRTADRFDGVVWVERAGLVFDTVADMGACTVRLFDRDGTLVHTMVDASPDAQGVYKVEQANPSLSSENLYYAVAVIAIAGIPGGLVSGAKGMFTV